MSQANKIMSQANNTGGIKNHMPDTFMDVDAQSKRLREKISARRKLKARRGIEQYFENKRLQRETADYRQEL